MPRHDGATSRWQRWRGVAVAALLLASQLACGSAQATPTATPTALPSPTAAFTAARAPTPAIPFRAPPICPDLPGRFEVLGQAGGRIGPVVAQDYYVYLGAGPRLEVLDLTRPAQPRLVGQVVSGTARITGLAVAGDYAYAADRIGRVHVVEVADPARPREVAWHDSYTYAHDLTLVDGYLYLAGETGFCVIDVRDPLHPVQVAFYDTPGQANQVLVVDGLAFVTGGAYSGYPYRDLRIFDVSDPARPRELALYGQQAGNGTWAMWAVGRQGRYAYVAAEGSELRVLDLADPARPVEVGSYPVGGEAHRLQASDTLLTLAVGGSLLRLDLSDPARPRKLSRQALPGPGAIVALAGDQAYAVEHRPAGYEPSGSDYVGVLHVYEIASPQGWTELGRFEVRSAVGWSLDTQAYRLWPAGSLLYVAADKAGLQVLDLADPAAPKLLGSGGGPGFFYDMALLQGANHALVADGSWGPAARAGLRVFDVTDPARIAQVGFYDSPGNALAVAVAGHTAYLADGERGLRIVDVADPTHPFEVSASEAPGFARGVAIVGRYACVADQKQGLRIVDVADSDQPRQVALYAPDGRGALSVVAAGELIYLPTIQGVSILRLTGAGEPLAVGQIALRGASLVAVGDGLACVATWEAVYAYDVADPARPKPLACLDMHGAGTVQALSIANGKAYVATSLSGLFVLRVKEGE